MQITPMGYDYGYSNQKVQKTQKANSSMSFGQLNFPEEELLKLNQHLFNEAPEFITNQPLLQAAIKGFEGALEKIAKKWGDVTSGVNRSDVNMSVLAAPNKPESIRLRAESSFHPNPLGHSVGFHKEHETVDVDFSGLQPEAGVEYGAEAGKRLAAGFDKVIKALENKVPKGAVGERAVGEQAARQAGLFNRKA
jgi:hypothetical protein